MVPHRKYQAGSRRALRLFFATVLTIATVVGCSPESANQGSDWLDQWIVGDTPNSAAPLDISPIALDFGETTDELTLALRSKDGQPRDCTIQARTAWVFHDVARATVAGGTETVNVSVNRSGLSDGEHVTALLIRPESGGVVEVPVRTVVPTSSSGGEQTSDPNDADSAADAGWDTDVDLGGTDPEPGRLELSTESLEFGESAQTLSFTLSYIGDGDTSFVVTPTADWISVEPISGDVGPTGVTIKVSIDRSIVAYGDWSELIEVLTEDGPRESVQAHASVTEPPWPAFALSRSDGTFHTYTGSESYFDNLVDARLIDRGDDRWELQITPRAGGIREVWFPWQPNRYALGGDDSDDVIYYPRRIGVAYRSASQPMDEWQGQGYPGQCFSPLVTIADRDESRTIAAMNWPPLGLTSVSYARGKATLRYWGYLDYGVDYSFNALVCKTRGNERAGDVPWHDALDKYRQWLNAQMTAEGIYPINYPAAMLAAHGWMHVRLHYDAEFDVADLVSLYNAHSADLPWMQMWGQMSNYQYSPGDGLYEDPTPPLEPDEEVGCCLHGHAIHPRYLPDLPAFAQNVVAAGGQISYYARPAEPHQALDGSNPHYMDDFLDWMSQNEANGANAHYLDVLGGGSFGDPLAVAWAFITDFPPMTVIEFPVDLYPTAFLISGALYGGHEWATMPGETIDDLSESLTKVTAPHFGRYLLDDRIVFLGGANGDVYWWGESSGYHSHTERQAFLLGAKFDAPTQRNTTLDWPGYTSPVTAAVRLIIDERDRVDWWARGPRYRDRQGISNLPDGVDVRVFLDQSEKTLFCIDNWFEVTGESFLYQDQPIGIPTAKISIVEFDP